MIRKTLAVLTVLLCLVPGALAQVQSGTYRLQIEDVIRIKVWDESQIEAVVVVGRDGNITAPFIGLKKAVDRTTTELESELKDDYVRVLKLRNPIVSVTIERFRPIQASVGGRVQTPGVHEMRPGDTVYVLLSKGGSLLADADLRRATLKRKNSSELIPIDLRALLSGDQSQNFTIQDGDELLVQRLKANFIRVVGTVRNPGPVAYEDEMRLADAITLAQGEIPGDTKLSRIIVTRPLKGRPGEYVRIQCNLAEFFAKGDASQNILLQPGDIVFVPNTGKPNLDFINTIANGFFILDRFGIRIFDRP
jgi:polysaccharide biosynthesis/export protein